MMSKVSIVLFQIFLLSLQLRTMKSQTRIRAGYYSPEQQELPVSLINSTLFTHLICGFADLNSISYMLYLSPDEKKYIPTFPEIVKQRNSSVTTLLSIGGPNTDDSIYSSMVSNSSYRKSFIDSSIATARLYGFEGLDFYWLYPKTTSDMSNLIILFEEWRAAINLEARNSGKSQLILTVVVRRSRDLYSEVYPIDTVQQYVNWSHVLTGGYSSPDTTNVTAPPSALYDPTNENNIDNCVRGWIDAGLPKNKLVLRLAFYGYAWKLANSSVNGIGAPATGPAVTDDGFMKYKEIKHQIKLYSPNVTYDPIYVVNYFTIETSWIGFDDVDPIRAKVSYTKEMRLLGYVVWKVSFDDNWVLSLTAAQEDANISPPQQGANISPSQEDNKSEQNRPLYMILVIILPTTTAVMLVLGLVIYFRWTKKRKSRACMDTVQEPRSQVNNAAAAEDFNGNAPTLVLYSLADMEVATDNFSIENKLGEGGYGPVYKGVLQGQHVAVKRLSKTSTQGFEEFKNEVMLTANLQHINLVRLLGFCIDKEEHMLVYEYMSNKSLDYYLFDPRRKYILDWKKRTHIIEGICQGLLYLQEYSRLMIIHRDLKPSNVLLDENMKPKISDFGMARIFSRDGSEANTNRIVGTYGYAPPEYVKEGLYSTKSDVYSFGVLLLQIISGKRVSVLYGYQDRHLTLLDYAYELWRDGKGMEFMDSSLNDIYFHFKLERCLHVALLCVQEIPIGRPSMLEVSSMLRNEATDLMIPKKPGFSKKSDEDVKYDSTASNVETSSVNDTTTMSNLEAR